MATPLHHLEWMYVRAVLFRLASIIAVSAGIANLLPNEKIFDRRPTLQAFYEIVIFVVAALSLNWRAQLPSLDGEFLGFEADDQPQTLTQVRDRLRRRRERKRKR